MASSILYVGTDQQLLINSILRDIKAILSLDTLNNNDFSVETLQNLFHPELNSIVKIEDSITIEEAREFIKFFKYKAGFTKQKVGIILLADRLSLEAQNTLLKFLEEHPKHVHLILGATSLHSLLETIRSRVQIKYLQDNTSINNPNSYKDIVEKLIKHDIPAVQDYSQTLTTEALTGLGYYITQKNMNIKIKKKVLQTINNFEKLKKLHISQKQLSLFTLLKLARILNEQN